MTPTELNTLMTESARDAVTVTKEQFGIDLDYSSQSIENIDLAITNYLDTFREQALENKAIFTLCNIYGAYLGETCKTIVGGEWRIDDSNSDAPNVFLHINDNSYAFAGICYEKLVNDSAISVQAYFEAAINNHQS